MKNHLVACAAVVTLLCLLFTRAASAEIVNCNTSPSSCTVFNQSLTGGAYPYVYVHDAYFSDTSNTYFDPSNPGDITYIFGNGAVSEKAKGSLATGSIGVLAQGFTSGDLVNVSANDIFTLHGPASGGPVNITVEIHAAGTASLPPVGSSSPLVGGGDASVEVCGPGGSFACVFDNFNVGGLPFAGYSGPVFSENTHKSYLDARWTFSESAGSTFGVFYELHAGVAAGGTIDLYDPGQLSFTLPEGYSIDSVSGFQSPAPLSGVPEPSSLGLMALMIGLFFARHALRTNSSRAKEF
jgi:hypothetical protein